jgi:hypothetical protein
MHPIRYRFAPPGSMAEPGPGELYLDTGNRLAPGVIDHHQPDAPARCTSALVLERPELVLSQVSNLAPGEPLTIVTHYAPDMDAVTAAVLVEQVLAGSVSDAARRLADYVCRIDRGETRLNPAAPITAYTIFLATARLASDRAGDDTDSVAMAALEAGARLIRRLIEQLDREPDPAALEHALAQAPTWAAERELIYSDLARYRSDLATAERLRPALPRVDGGLEPVPGLWVTQPTAMLFKAWARGDVEGAADPRGFVFLAVVLSPRRTILSVQPDQGVWLKGLGEALERAETAKRRQLGQERRGKPRPGYDSPDPWYDGRSPLHGWTIVDAPRDGSVLTPPEIRDVLDDWIAGGGCDQPPTGA